MVNNEKEEWILMFKTIIKNHGFNVTDKELPDYLPIMFEFASQVDLRKNKPVFEIYLKILKKLQVI